MLRKLEKYEILDEIGHGGMATVYRARDTRLDRDVAVKVMHPHLRGAREARARFAREARTVARLKHKNILEIYDYSGEDSEESYIATELLTGPTLKQFAETHAAIPAEIAAAFVIEVARALHVAHEGGIIHRDVKPENVLLHEARDVKLTDFGIASMVDAQSMTATGQILGSPGHMAPEQVEGKECDARADLFSLGTVLYFLATGKLPFAGRNPHNVLKKIMDGEYADPMRVRPSIGGHLRAIIARSLQVDPAKRFASAAELEKELVDFVREVGIEDSTATLHAYLKDPEGTTADLRRRTIDALTTLGEKAANAGDVPTALDHFNRVLALDETNQRVLALVERVGRRSRRRTGLVTMLSIGGVLAAGAAAYALVVPAGISPVGHAAQGNDTDPRTPRIVPVAPNDHPVRPIAARGRDAGAPQIRIQPRIATKLPPTAFVANTPRTVLLAPSPGSVSIAVDDAPARVYGPSFHEVTLAPGPHRFRITSSTGCCEDADFTQNIPPGAGPFRLERTLGFRRAALYVVSNVVSASVEVADGPRGRAREILRVPMTRLTETRTITVTADGHRAYTTTVQLTAGQNAEVNATLEPLSGPP